LKSHQAEDSEILSITHKMETGENLPQYCVHDGLLFCQAIFNRKPKLVLPQHLVSLVFRFYHESPLGGHLGIYKTIREIRDQFIWKNMDGDIRAHIKACHICRLSKLA
jgi:hypothetical protein